MAWALYRTGYTIWLIFTKIRQRTSVSFYIHTWRFWLLNSNGFLSCHLLLLSEIRVIPQIPIFPVSMLSTYEIISEFSREISNFIRLSIKPQPIPNKCIVKKRLLLSGNEYVIRKPCNLIIKLATAVRHKHCEYWHMPWVLKLLEAAFPPRGSDGGSMTSSYFWRADWFSTAHLLALGIGPSNATPPYRELILYKMTDRSPFGLVCWAGL